MLDLVHALADSHRRGKMINRINPLQRPVDRSAVANIAEHEFDIRIQIFRRLLFRAMHLRAQEIEYFDRMATLQ
jgi:hypothetical protein